MTHDDILDLAALGFERTLEPAQQEALDDHLRECASCRDEMERMDRAHGALTAWGAMSAPLPLTPSGPPSQSPSAAPGARRVPAWPWLAAASLVGLLAAGGAGFAVGRSSGQRDIAAASQDPAADAGTIFTLLLEEPASAWPPVDGGMRPGYVAWRDSLAAAGRFAGGARFVPDAGWYVTSAGDALPTGALASDARPAPNYSGYFLVRARDYAEAVAIARGSPHLAFGGILVRGPAAP